MKMSVKELILMGESRLSHAGILNAKGESREIYKVLFNCDDRELLMEWQKSKSYDDCEKYFQLLDRRCNGEPLQYIIGSQNFYGYDFKVSEGVLIPRLDSETVVEKALEIVKENRFKRILDLCCGSGVMGITIAKESPDTKVTLSDASKVAVTIARENADALDVAKRCQVAQGDLFLPHRSMFGKKKFQMIISNPPYIPSGMIKTLDREVKDFEPLEALDGGETGLDFYEKIAASAKEHLEKGGFLVLEIGHDQGESVPKLFAENGFEEVQVFKDLAGHDRIVVAR